jgi:hypothetical protein
MPWMSIQRAIVRSAQSASAAIWRNDKPRITYASRIQAAFS